MYSANSIFLVAVLGVDTADRLLNLNDAGVETKALLLVPAGVRGTSGNPDGPGVAVLGTGAGHERSVVVAEDKVSRLVNMPSLSLRVATVRSGVSVLENTLSYLFVSRDSPIIAK
jgi:hypothetical protein